MNYGTKKEWGNSDAVWVCRRTEKSAPARRGKEPKLVILKDRTGIKT